MQSGGRICLRVGARRGVLDLLDEAGHVLQEQVVHVLLVHVPQLDAARGVGHGHRVTGVAAVHGCFFLAKEDDTHTNVSTQMVTILRTEESCAQMALMTS